MWSLLLLACNSTPAPFVAGDDTDNPAEVGERCASTLEVVLPEGERVAVPCIASTVTATMELDPDDAPEVRTLTVVIDGAGSEGFECAVTLAMQGLCGPATYPLGNKAAVRVETWDCEGAPDPWEASLVATRGEVVLSTLESDARPGNLTGQLVPVRLEGTLALDLPRGARLEGGFDLRREVTVEDAEEQVCAEPAPEVPEVEAITGGELVGSASGGGMSANWRYTLSPGTATLPSVCSECDRAAVLQLGALEGTAPVDQSGQTTAYGVRTHTGEAFQLSRSGQWEPWGRGTATTNGWSGTRSFSAGGRTGNENLTLSW